MKKLLITIASILTLVCTPAVSLEWGGLLKNKTEAVTPDFTNNTFSQSEEVYFWLKTPFAKESPFYVIGEVVYKADISVYPTFQMDNIVDVDLLKAGGTLEIGGVSTLTAFAGRFNVADSAQKLFTQLFDGAQVSFNLPYFGFSMFGGYTGFVNSHTTSMMDKEGTVFSAVNPLYSMNLPYLVGEARMDFPSIFGTAVSLEGLGFFDIRDFNESRYFAEFSIAGPYRSSLYYKFTTVVGLNNDLEISNYSSIDYYYYPAQTVMIQVGCEYASGEIGPLKPFVPVTSQVACASSDAPALCGVIVPNLSFTFTTSTFYASLGGKFVFDMPYDKISIKGPEADLNIQYNVFSDLKITADVTAFYDLSESGLTNYTASAGCAISF